MIEPEVSFATLKEDIALAQDYLKFCVAAALTRCDEDLAFFENATPESSDLRQRLQAIVDTPFIVLDYTDAVTLLLKSIAAKEVVFENMEVHWGMDLGDEQCF